MKESIIIVSPLDEQDLDRIFKAEIVKITEQTIAALKDLLNTMNAIDFHQSKNTPNANQERYRNSLFISTVIRLIQEHSEFPGKIEDGIKEFLDDEGIGMTQIQHHEKITNGLAYFYHQVLKIYQQNHIPIPEKDSILNFLQAEQQKELLQSKERQRKIAEANIDFYRDTIHFQNFILTRANEIIAIIDPLI